jgi:multicomponent Na+:H+ antiporter subunit E
MSLLALGAWLVAMWIALWGEVTVANVAGGVLAATAVLVTYRVAARPTPAYAIRPLAAVRFLGYFLVKLFEANLVLAWEVITPRNKINEGIVAVPIRGCSDGLITLVANSITLTPGTVTLEVSRDPAVLYVHVLHLRDIDEVRRDVQHLEDLVVRAFGSPEAIALLAGDRAREAAARDAAARETGPREEAP